MTASLVAVVGGVHHFASYFSENGTRAIIFFNDHDKPLSEGVMSTFLQKVAEIEHIPNPAAIAGRRVDGCIYLTWPSH